MLSSLACSRFSCGRKVHACTSVAGNDCKRAGCPEIGAKSISKALFNALMRKLINTVCNRAGGQHGSACALVEKFSPSQLAPLSSRDVYVIFCTR